MLAVTDKSTLLTLNGIATLYKLKEKYYKK